MRGDVALSTPTPPSPPHFLCRIQREDIKSDLQPGSDVEIASRHCRCAKEDVTAVSTRTTDLDAVLAAMSSGYYEEKVCVLVKLSPS